MEAQKLKKKLDGTIFRGKKMKVEEAKKRNDVSPEDDVQDEGVGSTTTRGQKRKRGEGVIAGHELARDRKVKRGWTEVAEPQMSRSKSRGGKRSKEKKKKAKKSEYANKEELLFKTKLPANKRDIGRSKNLRNKSIKGQADQIVVHEFENRTKHPSFLRQPAGLRSGVKEGSDQANPKISLIANDVLGSDSPSPGRISATSPVQSAESTSSEESSSGPEAAETEAPRSKRTTAKIATPSTVPTIQEEPEFSSEAHHNNALLEVDDETSSSGLSNSEEGGDHDKVNVNTIKTSQISSLASSTEAATPHALETLFKRPASQISKSTPTQELSINPTPFSFFSGNADEDADGEGTEIAEHHSTPATVSTSAGFSSVYKRGPKPPSLAIPATPHTTMDKQWRAQRSAAPTPDTAAPNKSEFTKWFYEHRGESLRDSKRRRREAKREERARQNKRKARK
ncbi:MAG: hypothetical protein MMC23_000015 [Stictis urceolatum]|nr:hypothetical protein [Stictis urceolata]